jgi:hypothetical protein
LPSATVSACSGFRYFWLFLAVRLRQKSHFRVARDADRDSPRRAFHSRRVGPYSCHCKLADRSNRPIAGTGDPVPGAGRCLSAPRLSGPRPLQPARGDARGPTDAGSPAERRGGRVAGAACSACGIAGRGDNPQYHPRWRRNRVASDRSIRCRQMWLVDTEAVYGTP